MTPARVCESASNLLDFEGIPLASAVALEQFLYSRTSLAILLLCCSRLAFHHCLAVNKAERKTNSTARLRAVPVSHPPTRTVQPSATRLLDYPTSNAYSSVYCRSKRSMIVTYLLSICARIASGSTVNEYRNQHVGMRATTWSCWQAPKPRRQERVFRTASSAGLYYANMSC